MNFSLLFKAAANGDVPSIRRYEDDLSCIVNGQGRSLLHEACINGRRATCVYLINRGCDVNARDKTMRSPLHDAASAGFVEICELLIDCCCNVNAMKSNQWTPLHLASQHGQFQCCMKLCDAGATTDIKNKDGWTCLHLAARSGYTDIVSYLISHHNVAINARTNNGRTALHTACLNGNFDCVRLLVQCHADVNVQDSSGVAPLHDAVSISKNVTDVSIINTSLDIVDLLVKHGADLNVVDCIGNSPLLLSSYHGHTCIIEKLCFYGADILKRDRHGYCAIETALSQNHEDTARCMIKYLSKTKALSTIEHDLIHSRIHTIKIMELINNIFEE